MPSKQRQISNEIKDIEVSRPVTSARSYKAQIYFKKKKLCVLAISLTQKKPSKRAKTM